MNKKEKTGKQINWKEVLRTMMSSMKKVILLRRFCSRFLPVNRNYHKLLALGQDLGLGFDFLFFFIQTGILREASRLSLQHTSCRHDLAVPHASCHTSAPRRLHKSGVCPPPAAQDHGRLGQNAPAEIGEPSAEPCQESAFKASQHDEGGDEAVPEPRQNNNNNRCGQETKRW